MTEEEKEILYLLNDVYYKYDSLPEQHHSDKGEFVNALHTLQHLVMIRSVRRRNPDMFPLCLKAEVELKDLDDMTPLKDAVEKTLKKAFGANDGETRK